MSKTQTVFNEKRVATKVSFTAPVMEHEIHAEVQSSGSDLSYEGRSVYFEMSTGRGDLIHTSLNAEDAITLGRMLIEAGQQALVENMIGHQFIHHYSELERFVREDRVARITMTVIDDHPVNYGTGYRIYAVKPYWKDGMAPEFQENFEFETVMYWSPFDDEFKEQLKNWFNPELIGYNRYDEIAEFNKGLKEFEEGQNNIEG